MWAKVVRSLLGVRHYCGLRCSSARHDGGREVFLQPRLRRSLRLADVSSAFLARDVIGAAARKMIDDACLFPCQEFILWLHQLLSEASPRAD